MKLELRKIKDCFEKPLQYSEHFERWKMGNNSFSYYRFHAPERYFTLQIVSTFISSEGVFDCSGPPIWVAHIDPIALVEFEGNLPLRIYGAGKIRNEIDFYLAHSLHLEGDNPNDYFSKVYKLYSSNERKTPQEILERLVRAHKPDKWSWDEIIDLVYENITKARDSLLDYITQLPNENFVKVVGALNLTKPCPSSFE